MSCFLLGTGLSSFIAIETSRRDTHIGFVKCVYVSPTRPCHNGEEVNSRWSNVFQHTFWEEIKGVIGWVSQIKYLAYPNEMN